VADRHNRDIDRPKAPLPDPLPLPCVDSHAHLEIVTNTGVDDPALDEVIEESKSVGIDRIVQVGYSAEQSEWSVAVRGIGETGLDFFRTEEALQERQRYSFRRHIDIAKRKGKALIIHDRDAHRAVLDVLDEEGAPEITIFHCYSGDVEMARECVRKGYYLSFAGTLTFKNAPHLREAILEVPKELLLAETDSPFLAPMPFRGYLNTPAQTARTITFMADTRGDDLEILIENLSNNAERCFGSFASTR